MRHAPDVPDPRDNALRERLGTLEAERDALRARIRATPTDTARLDHALLVVSRRIRTLQDVRAAAAVPVVRPEVLSTCETQTSHRASFRATLRTRTTPRRTQ